MITKKMIQSTIDFIGTEYHKRLTNKEWDLIVNRLWDIHERSKANKITGRSGSQ